MKKHMITAALVAVMALGLGTVAGCSQEAPREDVNANVPAGAPDVYKRQTHDNEPRDGEFNVVVLKAKTAFELIPAVLAGLLDLSLIHISSNGLAACSGELGAAAPSSSCRGLDAARPLLVACDADGHAGLADHATFHA